MLDHGERKFVAAILHSALKDIEEGSRRDFATAQQFFFSEPSHFAWMARALDIDPSVVRERILKRVQKRRKRKIGSPET